MLVQGEHTASAVRQTHKLKEALKRAILAARSVEKVENERGIFQSRLTE